MPAERPTKGFGAPYSAIGPGVNWRATVLLALLVLAGYVIAWIMGWPISPIMAIGGAACAWIGGEAYGRHRQQVEGQINDPPPHHGQ